MRVFRRCEGFCAGLIALAGMCVAFLVSPRDFEGGDTIWYLQMVRGEGAAAPWAYRVLAPGIVRILPMAPEQGFFFVTWASTFSTLFALYFLCRKEGVSILPSRLTIFLVACSFPIAFYLGTWGLIDPLGNFFFTLGLYLIFNRRYAIATSVIVVGVFAKETTLLLLPLLIVGAIRDYQDRSPLSNLGYTLLLATFPMASFLLLRILVTPLPGQLDLRTPGDLTNIWRIIWTYNMEAGVVPRIARELLRSYGFFWILAILGFLSEMQRKWDFIYLIGAGFFLCTIATDWSGMLGTIFPAIFLPMAKFVELVWSLSQARVILTALVISAIAQTYLSLIGYRDLGSTGQLALIVGIVSVFILGTLISFIAYLRLRQQKFAMCSGAG